MADDLTDSDPRLPAVPDDRTPSVDISVQGLMEIVADRHVAHHEKHCPASKAYQRIVGIVGLGVLMMGGVVCYGQSVLDTKIDRSVEKAFKAHAEKLATAARPLSPFVESPIIWPPRALAATPLRAER